MVQFCHINVAKSVLPTIEEMVNWPINKFAYVFGSIAPDINCCFPCHTINSTYKRFERRLNRILSSKSSIVRSFTLGVVMHYICDYFCFVHNVRQHGPRHTIYERYMTHHLKHHFYLLNIANSDIEEQWYKLEAQLLSNAVIQNHTITNIDFILDLLYEMHDIYFNKISESIQQQGLKHRWYFDTTQIEEDINYAKFVGKAVMKILLKGNTQALPAEATI